MWPFQKNRSGDEHASKVLNPFIAMAVENLHETISPGQSQQRLLIESYIYGAIRYLASYDDLSPDQTERLMQDMLSNHFNADSTEVTNSLSALSQTKDGSKKQLFMIEGASALRRWLVDGDRTVTTDLQDLLDLHS